MRLNWCALMLIGLAGVGSLPAAAGSRPEGAVGPARIGRQPLQTRGIWTYFEDPSEPNGWYSGELLRDGQFAAAKSEVAAQLDHMRAMGVNEIAYELRSADSVWIPGERKPPECNVAPDTGLQWPQPTPEELSNLGRLFELAHAKGIRIALVLNNTHMEERPPTNAETWLGSILRAVRDKPALDYVAFGGDDHLIDLDGNGTPESCGGLSEAPLWLGASSVQGRYVQWAIAYGRSLGLSPRQLTAEAIVGFYPHEMQAPAGPDAEDGHLWRPLPVLRTIFDRAGIPAAERTYALSFYEHRKCAGSFIPCADEAAQPWTEEMARAVRPIVGTDARVTATEFGILEPVDRTWQTEAAVEGLGVLMQQYGIDGGTFWKWADETGQAPASSADPVMRRGFGYSYNPVQRELIDLYGYHVTAVPNGSFEQGRRGWKKRGRGTARVERVELGGLAWRGRFALRLQGRPRTWVIGEPIRVAPRTTYTTSGTYRAGRRSSVGFRYLTCSRTTSRLRPETTFLLPQSKRFRTTPLRYVTPRDACFVEVVLSTSSMLVADAVR